MPPAARAATVLHAVLFAGLAAIGGAFILVMHLQGGPLVSGAGAIGYVLAAAGVATLGYAALAVRPRIPERAAGQATDEYWRDGNNRGPAVLVWLLCEGAGVIGWVGYLITGMLVATVPAVLGLVALLAYGPSRLAGE